MVHTFSVLELFASNIIEYLASSKTFTNLCDFNFLQKKKQFIQETSCKNYFFNETEIGLIEIFTFLINFAVIYMAFQ